jgi:hypothetical protein
MRSFAMDGRYRAAVDAVSTRGVAKIVQRSRSSGTFEPVGPVVNVMS